jgi:hypothetical protein
MDCSKGRFYSIRIFLKFIDFLDTFQNLKTWGVTLDVSSAEMSVEGAAGHH